MSSTLTLTLTRWAGVEYAEAVGKNDGAVKGVLTLTLTPTLTQTLTLA